MVFLLLPLRQHGNPISSSSSSSHISPGCQWFSEPGRIETRTHVLLVAPRVEIGTSRSDIGTKAASKAPTPREKDCSEWHGS